VYQVGTNKGIITESCIYFGSATHCGQQQEKNVKSCTAVNNYRLLLLLLLLLLFSTYALQP